MNEQLQFGEAETGRNACPTGDTLFDRWRELDALVVAALRASLLSEREKEVLRVIAGHKGAAKAIRSEDVAAAARMEWNECTRREIAGVVEACVLLHRIPIGGLRMKPYGYFLITNAKDLELAITPLWGEVYAHLRRLRALTGKQLVARMFGQAMLKLDEESGECRVASGEPKEAA